MKIKKTYLVIAITALNLAVFTAALFLMKPRKADSLCNFSGEKAKEVIHTASVKINEVPLSNNINTVSQDVFTLEGNLSKPQLQQGNSSTPKGNLSKPQLRQGNSSNPPTEIKDLDELQIVDDEDEIKESIIPEDELIHDQEDQKIDFEEEDYNAGRKGLIGYVMKGTTEPSEKSMILNTKYNTSYQEQIGSPTGTGSTRTADIHTSSNNYPYIDNSSGYVYTRRPESEVRKISLPQLPGMVGYISMGQAEGQDERLKDVPLPQLPRIDR